MVDWADALIETEKDEDAINLCRQLDNFSSNYGDQELINEFKHWLELKMGGKWIIKQE